MSSEKGLTETFTFHTAFREPLTAPCAGMDEPWSTEKVAEFSAALALYEDGGEASEICLPQAESFLNAIKAFTGDYPASVFIDSGKYIIYYQDDELFAETDLELWDIIHSVKILEGATQNG